MDCLEVTYNKHCNSLHKNCEAIFVKKKREAERERWRSSQDLDGEQNHGSITLTYVDKDKTRTSYSLQGVMESSKAHILKRLRYTKSVIHELLSGKLSNPKGGSTVKSRPGVEGIKLKSNCVGFYICGYTVCFGV